MPKQSSKASAEDKLQYVLTVLSYTELPQPNYQAIKTATGQSTANVAQKKFKAYIEQAGFGLVDRQIIRPDGGESEAEAEPTTKAPSPKPQKARNPKTTPKPTAKKSATKRTARQASTHSVEDEEPRASKKQKTNEIIELWDEEVEEAVKVENPAEDIGGAGDVEREEQTEEETDQEEEQDRHRRSRARSRTAKPEDVI